MDAKEVKATLKKARNAIQNKEFKEALKCCKSVLAHDKTNYNALVFVGVAAEGLEQTDQALKAYKKATSECPNQLLAWQGLCAFYEKNPNPENNTDLVQVYEQLLTLHTNAKEKEIEITKKLIILLASMKEEEEKVMKLFGSLVCEGHTETVRDIVSVIQRDTSHSETLLLRMLNDAASLSDFLQDEVMIKKYLDLLVTNCDVQNIEKVCSQLHEQFPSMSAPLQTLLQLLLDKNMGCELVDEQIRHLSEKLRTLDNGESTAIAHIATGYLDLCGKKFVQAREHIQKGVDADSSLVCGHYYLSRSLFHIHADSDCIQACLTGLSSLEKKQMRITVSRQSVQTLLKLIQTKCLIRKGTEASLRQAEDILTKMNDVKHEDVQFCLALIHIAKQDMEKVEKCISLSSMESKKKIFLTGLKLFSLKHFEEALKSFNEAAVHDADNSEVHFMLGKTLWELRTSEQSEVTKKKCIEALLKAAQLDPYNSHIFLYLGHFYTEIQNDNVRARKCYQKAFQLDNSSEEAGAALCDMMVAMGDEEAAKSLLLSVTDQCLAASGKWAWLRLGLYQMKHEDPSVAIKSFQSALRADPADHRVWECLAESYLYRGSYTAALKAFNKAAELDPDSMYSLYQMANIKQAVGELTEAISEYKTILTKSPNYVPALKGVGETLMLLAKENLGRYLNDLARDNCQEAIVYLTRAAAQRPDFCCLWKLLGDVCTSLHRLAAETFSIEVPVKLTRRTVKDSKETCVLNKLQLLQLGARCYGKALKDMPDSDWLWHDLGVNYFHQSEAAGNDNAKSLAEKSVQALKRSLTLNGSDFRHWNALGVVACTENYYRPDLAQHCFIKSIKTENNNAVAWTNLGALYLKEDNVKRAHIAFKMAQNLDPSYVACWIGQALVAETVDHDEAMDLFRHTTELGNHLEGAVGYGHWVCRTLTDSEIQNTEVFKYCIEHMSAIQTASDVLMKYTSRVKTDPAVYNMLGMLLEYQGLFSSSVEAYRTASTLLQDCDVDDDRLLKVRLNLARVLCENKAYGESIAVYSLVLQHTLCEDLAFLGLALYKTEQIQQSFEVYEQALSKAESDEDKSHLYAALGMVLYKFNDVEAAKTAFFSSCQLTPPSSTGLLALCSLGLTQCDWTLAGAVLQELTKLKPDEQTLPHFAYLTAVFHTLQGDILTARRHLETTTREHSHLAGVWKQLVLCLMQWFPHMGRTAATCCAVSQHLNSARLQFISRLLSLAQLQGGCHHRLDPTSNVIKTAQRTLHMYPDDVSSLCVLTAALHGEAVIELCFSKGKQLFQVQDRYIERILKTEVSAQVRDWCLRLQLISFILRGDTEQTQHIIQKMKEENKEDIFLHVMSGVIADDVETVQKFVQQENTDIYLQKVLQHMMRNKTCETDSTCLSTKCEQVVSLYFKQTVTGQDNSEMMKSVFDEASTEVLKKKPQSSAVLLMLALIALKDNVRLAKRYFLLSYDVSCCHDNFQYGQQIARRHLIKICHNSSKDSQLLQKLLSDAAEQGDLDTVHFYESLQTSSNK